MLGSTSPEYQLDAANNYRKLLSNLEDLHWGPVTTSEAWRCRWKFTDRLLPLTIYLLSNRLLMCSIPQTCPRYVSGHVISISFVDLTRMTWEKAGAPRFSPLGWMMSAPETQALSEILPSPRSWTVVWPRDCWSSPSGWRAPSCNLSSSAEVGRWHSIDLNGTPCWSLLICQLVFQQYAFACVYIYIYINYIYLHIYMY